MLRCRATLLILTLVGLCSSETLTKGINFDQQPYVFITRFAFNEGAGRFLVKQFGAAPDPASDMRLYAIDQAAWKQFYTQYKSGYSLCDQMPLQSQMMYRFKQENNETFSMDHQFNEITWSNVVLVRCGTGATRVQFEMQMLNLDKGPFTVQFSVEKQGIPQGTLFFAFVYLFLFIIHCVAGYRLWKTEEYVLVIKLVTIGLGLECVSAWLQFFDFAVYSADGFGAPSLGVTGLFAESGADLLLIGLVILLAQGWVSNTISLLRQRITVIVVIFFFVLYLILIILMKLDIGAFTFYSYETVPGILMIVSRALLWIYFIGCSWYFYRSQLLPQKKRFTLKFGIAMSVWFLMMPLATIIASGVVSYKRAITVSILLDLDDLFAWLVLVWLTLPRNARQHFALKQPSRITFTHEDTNE